MTISIDRALTLADATLERNEWSVDGLPRAIVTVYLVASADSGIVKDGLPGWMANLGAAAEETVRAYERIGAKHCAKLLARATAIVAPSGFPSDDAAFTQLFEDLSDACYDDLGALADQWFEYRDYVGALFEAYVAAHSGELEQLEREAAR